jgi:hypothetical protein
MGDGLAPHVWSDDQIYDALSEAVIEYSHRLQPRTRKYEGTMVVGQRGPYNILGTLPESEEMILVRAVEWPAGTLIPHDRSVPHYAAALDSAGLTQAYAMDQFELRVCHAPTAADPFVVHWLATRELPADDATPAPVRNVDEGLVCLMACRSLWETRRMEDAKRGLRTPNSANPFAGRVERMVNARKRWVRAGRVTE